MLCGNCMDLSDKVLRDKVFSIAKYLKYNEYQHRLASLVYNILDKKSSASGVKSETMSNQELAKELHKILRKFDKQNVYLSLTDNI